MSGNRPHAQETAWWRTRGGLVLCGFLLITAFYLLTEHTAHLFGVLPYLLLLLCPLMHLFMHHGHGAHGSHDTSGGVSAQNGKEAP